MAVIKCKMCGGDLNLVEDSSVCECEYCGTKQTVPKVDDEKKLKLFSRAGKLLRGCEFDKAAGVFESIVADFPEEAEAYWGLVLCKYGIEYVDDPATGKKIPTCHRSSFESVEDDANFEQACENADAIARRVYREEARQIEALRTRILEVSGQEEPYDVFISYKELDEDGDRTSDSVIAQDIYKELSREGYRVFFSRISLEGKLGVEYEPYIFAALNSAKVMIVVGTDYEYLDAVWVKNEWSRFLKLIASGQKKTLIPVYRDMDPYDMPKELRSLAAQDMGKIGAMQDLLHGVDKLLGKKQAAPVPAQPVVQQTVVQGGGPNVTALLGRGYLSLEDGDWEKAQKLFDQVLNMDFQNAEAYLGLAMAELNCENREALQKRYTEPGSNCRANKELARVRQFGDEELRNWVKQLDRDAEENDRREKEQREAIEKQERERAEAEKRRAEQEKIENAKRLCPERERIAGCQGMISAGWNHTVGLTVSSTVVATRYNGKRDGYCGQCKVSDWKDIVAVSAGGGHTVGLRADGTVVATKYPGKQDGYCGQCEVSDWKDIVAVSAGGRHTVGLRADGTVVATKYPGKQDGYCGQCEVSDWKDIVAVSAGDYHTVALKADGTVVAVGYNGNGQCNVSHWKDIVAVSAGGQYTVGMRTDGTVVAVGNSQCNVSDWKDIVAVSAGTGHIVGLRADGTVVATKYTGNPNYYFGQCNVSDWKNMVAVSAGRDHTVGLRADGTVVAAGGSYYGQHNVSGWKLFESIDTLDEERKAAKEKAEAERKAAEEERRLEAEKAEAERKAKIETLNYEKRTLSVELANLKGLFTGRRRKEIEARLAQIETELKKLG